MNSIKDSVLSALKNIPPIRSRTLYWYSLDDDFIMNLDLYAEAKEKSWSNLELLVTRIFSIGY